MEKKKQQIFGILPKPITILLEKRELDFRSLEEIRMRTRQPLVMKYNHQEQLVLDEQNQAYIITEKEIRETMEYVSHHSIYAYERQLSQGYITVEGGHRVGVTGKVIMKGGEIKNLQYISSINIRVAHEYPGAADPVFPFLTYNRMLHNTLIISPPGCGKTTLLRDLIRQISDGNRYLPGMSVGVVDERSEIAGCYQGVIQNHLGKRTDVLDGCPKAEGMILLIRSMTPQVIAVDELGGEEDFHALEYCMHCGCRVLATIHGESRADMEQKNEIYRRKGGIRFERYILLDHKGHAGTIKSIQDEKGQELWR